MPPTAPELTPLPPAGRGEDAAEWLASCGFVPAQPATHSSDFPLAYSCPFLFYLTRRLGLRSAFRWSKALSRGSWFHKRMEFVDIAEPRDLVAAAYKDRLDELGQLCTSLGVVGEPRQSILDREYKDMACACTWVDALLDWDIKGTTARTLLTQTFGLPVNKSTGEPAIEVSLSYDDPDFGRLNMRADRLAFNHQQRLLWCVDYKTVGGPIHPYLSGVSLAWQTRHYLYILQHKLPDIIRTYDLPADTRLAGMMHLAFEKPTIEFGLRDRDYTVNTKTISRGPNKGEVRHERVYSGEPTIPNYLARINEWYRGEGEYPDRKAAPAPVGYSLTHSEILTPDFVGEYRNSLSYVHDLATRKPFPANFPRNFNAVSNPRRPSEFVPFYLCDVGVWPEIILRNNMIQALREEDIPLEPLPGDT